MDQTRQLQLLLLKSMLKTYIKTCFLQEFYSVLLYFRKIKLEDSTGILSKIIREKYLKDFFSNNTVIGVKILEKIPQEEQDLLIIEAIQEIFVKINSGN